MIDPLPQTSGKLTFRRAKLEDALVLHHWDTLPHVIASDPDDDWDWEKELPSTVPWREQIMVEKEGKPLAFLQVIDPLVEESHYWGDVPPNLRALDIWIGPEEFLGQGYGTTILQWAIQQCFADPAVTDILLDPLATNTRAHRFYERLGFVFREARNLGGSSCFVYSLPRS